MLQHNDNSGKRQPQRRGVLMTEAIVAAILTSVLLAMIVPSLGAIRKQRQLQRFESLALIEINNQAETPGTSVDRTLSRWFMARYPDARLSVEPLESGSNSLGLPGMRLTIAREGQIAGADQKVSLVVWYPTEGAQP
jgi:hypothetical protein